MRTADGHDEHLVRADERDPRYWRSCPPASSAATGESDGDGQVGRATFRGATSLGSVKTSCTGFNAPRGALARRLARHSRAHAPLTPGWPPTPVGWRKAKAGAADPWPLGHENVPANSAALPLTHRVDGPTTPATGYQSGIISESIGSLLRIQASIYVAGQGRGLGTAVPDSLARRGA